MISAANISEIQKERKRRKVTASLLQFIHHNFHTEYQVNWHHEYVCSIFDQFLVGDFDRLMVFMPPQHGKSTMLTEYLPPHILGKNPDEKILIASYNAELASKFNRKIQRIIDSKKYQEIYPGTQISGKLSDSPNKNSYVRNSTEFEIVDHQGSLRSTGVGGGIAGLPVSLALLDDVIKNVQEAHSATHRRNTYDWYVDEVEARLDNNSKVAFTITRRHEEDLAGMLLERDGRIEDGGKWKVVNLPAIKEDDLNPDDPREIGEALWPEKHSLERMLRIQEKNPRTFASLYQQRPAPVEGNIIKKDWFKRYDPIRSIIQPSEIRFYLDSAYTDDANNDPSVMISYAVRGHDLYIIDVLRVHLEFPDLIRAIVNRISDQGDLYHSVLWIEPKASGKSIYQKLRSHTNPRLPVREDKPPVESKEVRVHSITPYLEAGQVLLKDGATWIEPFLSECISFPNGKHDDQVDCLSAIVRIELFRQMNLKVTYHNSLNPS